MRVVRNSFTFCRAQAYLQRFKDLEEQVNRREKEFIEKKEKLQRLRQLSHMTNQDLIQKYLSMIINRPFESEALQKESERLKSMHDLLKEIENEEKSRTEISKRLADEEKLNRERIFLSDLARFANKFHKVAYSGKFNGEVKVGIELSCKNLENKLQKQGVEFLGIEGEKQNKQRHERVDGEGDIIEEVLERGIKTRGQLISKAKIRAKKG